MREMEDILSTKFEHSEDSSSESHHLYMQEGTLDVVWGPPINDLVRKTQIIPEQSFRWSEKMTLTKAALFF